MPHWESIAREHGPLAFEIAWRILGHVHDTEDVVQEAFLDALRLYREQVVENWGGLLRRITTCRALDRLRKRRMSQPLQEEPLSPGTEGPEQQAEAEELADRLRTTLSELPEQQGRVFSLRYFGELSNLEIAHMLDMTAEGVAVSLHKARSFIAERLQVPRAVPRRQRT